MRANLQLEVVTRILGGKGIILQRLSTAMFSAILVCALQSLSLTATAADNAEILKAECFKQLNLGQSGCNCIGDRAGEVLNEKQQELVVAMVTKDQAKGAQIRGQMTMDEITGSANFMMSAPQICSTQ